MDLGLTGKITLITGSSGGIGKEVARAFLREGARVILNGTNAEKLEKTRAELAAAFGAENVAAKRCDVTDEEAVIAAAKACGCIVTAEEANILGGLGAAVAEVVCENCPVPVLRVGVEDTFGKSGPALELLEIFGLNAENIAAKAEKAIALKNAR